MQYAENLLIRKSCQSCRAFAGFTGFARFTSIHLAPSKNIDRQLIQSFIIQTTRRYSGAIEISRQQFTRMLR